MQNPSAATLLVQLRQCSNQALQRLAEHSSPLPPGDSVAVALKWHSLCSVLRALMLWHRLARQPRPQTLRCRSGSAVTAMRLQRPIWSQTVVLRRCFCCRKNAQPPRCWSSCAVAAIRFLSARLGTKPLCSSGSLVMGLAAISLHSNHPMIAVRSYEKPSCRHANTISSWKF